MSFQPGRFSADDRSPELRLRADVCIVGAGAGGSATALALVEDGAITTDRMTTGATRTASTKTRRPFFLRGEQDGRR